MKRCVRCGRTLPASPAYFGLDKRRPDGLDGRCRSCERARKRKGKYIDVCGLELSPENELKVERVIAARCTACDDKSHCQDTFVCRICGNRRLVCFHQQGDTAVCDDCYEVFHMPDGWADELYDTIPELRERHRRWRSRVLD